LGCRIQNALIDRTFLQQLLLELRVRDDPFSISSFANASAIASVVTISSSSDTDTGLPLSSSAIAWVSYLITLSALANRNGVMVTPICFAVLRLMINSNFVGCSTGMSAGFAPFKILLR
jgi:hypothetical protein